MSETFIRIRDLHKTYRPQAGPVEVLKGVSMEIVHGKSVAITGPSGSGKSTLLSLIAGLQKPDKGHIEIAGKDLEEMSSEEVEKFRALKIGIVFQDHYLLMQCTALENVLLPTLPFSIDPEEALKRASELLEKVGLANRADHFPSQLSGGEQHRVAIARALINRPALLLADEPTGRLEPSMGKEIVKLLTDNRDYTLISVTHANYVAKAMDVSYKLENGELALAKA
ncbi:MAG: ABC transporter ATP-binding protein [Candidatus Riflebacteria bacterium]|nr:ABC transporter ATP-binding protein [Candidatus Riflebacteria bacterium]